MTAYPEIARSPAARRVAVIGAGVVGLSCALWLQRAGHDVSVYDRNLPEDEAAYSKAASYGNACTFAVGACLPVAFPGILKAVPKMLADPSGPLAISWTDLPRLLPWLYGFVRASSPTEYSRITAMLGTLIRHASAAHESLMVEAEATHLADRHGCLYLYKSEAAFSAARRDVELREREGVAMRILSAGEIREREPHLAPLYHKGLLFSEAWRLDNPYRYVVSLADLFRKKGGKIHRAQISAIDRGASLRLIGPDFGDAYDRVVLAAGAWSSRLARTVDQRVLLDTERGYHVLFGDDGHLLSAPTCYPEHGFYMTPLSEGLRSAGTVELGGLDRPLRPRRTDVIEKTTRRLLPAVGQVRRKWLGFRPSMPDSLPVIGSGSVEPRVIHAYGHGHVGLTLAAVTGRIVADLVDCRDPHFDISQLSPNRFPNLSRF